MSMEYRERFLIMQMEAHKCAICGKVFPYGTAKTRKYCDDCQDQHRIRQLERQKELRKEAKMKASGDQQKHDPRMLKASDKAYCGKCIYRGRFSAEYLCDYLGMTGKRRGCKAGVGCIRRDIGEAKMYENRRICERCGAVYEGGKKSHICPQCRRISFMENARRIAEKRKENSDAG